MLVTKKGKVLRPFLEPFRGENGCASLALSLFGTKTSRSLFILQMRLGLSVRSTLNQVCVNIELATISYIKYQ